MTPIGHSLVGAAIGVGYCCAQEVPVRTHLPVILGIIACANLPDFPLPGWGHENYRVSHSLLIGALLVLGYVVVFRWLWPSRTAWGTWPLIAAGTLALFSHYLLDSFYNHGKGVRVLWPLSEVRMTLPIPWFATMTMDPLFSWHNVKTWSIELLCYGTLLAAVLVIHFKRLTKQRQIV